MKPLKVTYAEALKALDKAITQASKHVQNKELPVSSWMALMDDRKRLVALLTDDDRKYLGWIA